MEQLDLTALLDTSYDICEAILKANVGKIRTEKKNLKIMFRNDLALFGSYLAIADGSVSDAEATFILETLGFPPTAQMATDIRNKRSTAGSFADSIPRSLKYAVLSDAGEALKPDPFKRQSAMYFYDSFKVFGQSVLAQSPHDVSDAGVKRFTAYMAMLETMLRD